ncbi:MAG: HD domain-containing phosphohydrolase [Thermodesulfobacteriota bacterium]
MSDSHFHDTHAATEDPRPRSSGLTGPGTVLAIDDDETSVELLKDLLEMGGFKVHTACEGREGIGVFQDENPHAVITDIRMPLMDGLEVAARIREIDDTVPVIIATGFGDVENAILALREGAYDFLQKPVNAEILLNTVRRAVESCRLRRFERNQQAVLRELVEERTRELREKGELLLKSYRRIKRIQGASIFALAKLAEYRDEETSFHLRRIQEYCRALTITLGRREQYRDLISEQYLEDLVECSLLHDIGKVGLPDSILLCPRKFVDDEYALMKQHAVLGGKTLEDAAIEAGEQSFLSMGRDVAYYHHERWDGQGYPFRLKGEEIPLAARIVALADVYDALTTKRRYKRPFTHEDALFEIIESRGQRFDPEIVDAFVEVEGLFREIRDKFSRKEEVVPVVAWTRRWD